MIPPVSPALRRALAWATLLLALTSYLALAAAEQGAAPAGFVTPPPNPLPFARERVFGIDLRDRASVDALRWIQAASGAQPALWAIAIDPDVVAALGQEEQRPLAYSAVDLVTAAASSTPLALCLHKPPGTVGDLAVAQAVVGALRERYTASIAYVSGCPSADLNWRRAVAQATLQRDTLADGLDTAWLPLSAGASLNVEPAAGDQLARAAVRTSDAGRYVALTTPPRDTLDAGFTRDAQNVLRDNAHVALTLVRPSATADPAAFGAATNASALTAATLPHGFTGVSSAAMQFAGDWQPSTVGVTTYRRATANGATLTIDFVGSDLYLMTLLSANAGKVDVWLDPQGPDALPATRVSLNAEQARDGAVTLLTGLSAKQHRVVLASVDGAVTISGVFVAGRATPRWANGVAAVALLVVATAALASLCFAAVLDVRARAPLQSPTRGREHPRDFTPRR